MRFWYKGVLSGQLVSSKLKLVNRIRCNIRKKRLFYAALSGLFGIFYAFFDGLHPSLTDVAPSGLCPYLNL